MAILKVGDEQKRIAFGVDLYGSKFDFVPESVINKGVIVGGEQFWLRKVLDPEFQEKLSPYLATPFSVSNIDETTKQGIGKQLEQNKFADTKGYLIPSDISSELLKDTPSYYVNEVTPEGFVYGPIAGLATNEQGVKYYNVSASGRPGATAWIAPGATNLAGQYLIPGEKKKWYESPAGIIGGALLIGSGLGLAGIGPLAAGGAAAGGAAAGGAAAGGAAAGGTAAGLGGAAGTGITAGTTATGIGGGALGTGLTAGTTASGIGGGALGTGLTAGAAGAGLTAAAAAPISTATAIPAGELAYPGLEVAPSFTPAPGSLQATLPSLGVETAASTAPFTAVPGSFQAALPAFGVASAPSLAGNLTVGSSGISATDALRIANQARGLLGAGQNPIVPQQQGLPQGGGQAQGVDYSGLLSLLQLQAKTPGVSSLTQPAQLRQMYQTTLLPDVLSLLG